jgi:hypothetical protein
MEAGAQLPVELWSLEGRVVYFPVRHHSPTAARAVRDLIRQKKFSAILIEGPADFASRMDELYLPHELPIAIYSYARTADGARRGAYYPFCIYSPEWQALRAGRDGGAQVTFIDLPFSDMRRYDQIDARANRYSDAGLRGSSFVKRLADRLGVDGLDVVWDTLFELEPHLEPGDYIRRGHEFCGGMRLLDGGGIDGGSYSDRQREHFMAHQIRLTLEHARGQILVVTGGYHSLALYLRVSGENPIPDIPPEIAALEEAQRAAIPDPEPPEDDDDGAAASAPAAADGASPPPPPAEDRGIALTPYSYQRLDNLRGYDAGMPNPGFYDRLWHDRQSPKTTGATYRKLLFDVAKTLRAQKQRVSSADLIAAETCAQALARLRAHPEVWRTDLVDGLAGAVLKDELAAGGTHPLLEAVHEVLRGAARGSLAAGTSLPPLVVDMQRQLAAHRLQPEMARRDVPLDLLDAGDRVKSILLHRLRILGIAGFARTAGTDFLARQEMSRVDETWTLAWSPEFDATAIEAARYGPAVADAAAARLAEVAGTIQRSACDGAALMVDAALAEVSALAAELQARVDLLIRQDGEFLSVTRALSHLLYLYRYDEALGSSGRGDVGALLKAAFGRGIWLLEILGQIGGEEVHVVEGVRTLVQSFERCDTLLGMTRSEFTDVLARVQADALQLPMVRGAAMGALWALQAADTVQVRALMKLFADPQKFGDFLTGLFGLAREIVQREKDLLLAIDETVGAYSPEDFLEALPALRLAFTYFTPREKHYVAVHLLESLRDPAAIPPAAPATASDITTLAVNPEDAVRALALEARLLAAVERYGLRGAS